MNNQYKLLLLIGLLLPAYVLAEDSESDCHNSDINYIERPGMTRAERLEAMNQAFFESVNRFDECNLSVSTSSSASSSSPSTTSGAEGNNDSVSGTEGKEAYSLSAQAEASVASSGLSGTETESVNVTEIPESLETSTSETETNVNEHLAHTGPIGQGKTPEDIPDANNDDVIAAQIRLAAEIETDPDKKAKLWNEYRKYKGLPTQ